ncbi:PIN domain-containing protein [Candidatus Bathyarchaeota archaeon]|nr:PIN domain-containing protein [Candidatus Bathyarchaeota archaeon]
MKTLRGDITLDASALIEYLMGTELGRILKEYFETLKAGEKVYCSLYTISEIFYVICRLKGLKFAVEKMNAMLNSRMIEVNNTERMALEAGRLKCERAISLGDCSCIATAKITRSKAVFARREKELKKEMKKRPFNVEIIFLTEATN